MSTELDLQVLRRLADMHAVYRMFDARGRLLYIGITGDIGTRFGSHAAKRWFPQVETIKLEWHPAKAAAQVAERQAIRAEHPRHNIAHARPPRQRPMVPLTLQQLGGRATLAEAVAAKLVTGTLAAVRKAAQRDQAFPEPSGRRGVAFLYDAVKLAEWDAGRH